ncbi:hypothetical protein ACTDI4_21055 [Mesorhizobium sp. PUT5]|uniref:hypothetical protein n=1 Tax=Mesorhizobium sp. PUT5 TaxID=3454629 RepID=UPI003FA47BA8
MSKFMSIHPKTGRLILLAGVAAAALALGTCSGAAGATAALAMTAAGRMTSGEALTLHAALFFVSVWIVSSLRIRRLRALWRVGPWRLAMRGASGGLPPRGPKARAATGGSVAGAGFSGAVPNGTGGRAELAWDAGLTGPLSENFRS